MDERNGIGHGRYSLSRTSRSAMTTHDGRVAFAEGGFFKVKEVVIKTSSSNTNKTMTSTKIVAVAESSFASAPHPHPMGRSSTLADRHLCKGRGDRAGGVVDNGKGCSELGGALQVKVGELADSATSNAVKLHRSSGKLRKLYMYRFYVYRSTFGYLLDGQSLFVREL